MPTLAITDGIHISAITSYLEELSAPGEAKYSFSYKIKIENKSEYTVQLMRRHWQISNSNGNIYEVEGEGVVGEQPVLAPGQSHEYISGCVFETSFGKMTGSYLFKILFSNKNFRARVPDMNFTVPHLLN